MFSTGIIYTKSEINKIRKANKIVAEVLQIMRETAKEGITTYELEEKAEKVILKNNCIPAFKGYRGFPFTLCTSINDTVVHGFPSKKDVIKKGDLISIDVGVIYEGYYGDACITEVIEANKRAENIKNLSYDCLDNAISILKSGIRIGNIGEIIEKTANNKGYEVIKDYVGHSIGNVLHAFPHIFNYGKQNTGAKLLENMVICIEPMLVEKSNRTYITDNGWDVKTVDGGLATQVEHCILINKNGYEILSKL